MRHQTRMVHIAALGACLAGLVTPVAAHAGPGGGSTWQQIQEVSDPQGAQYDYFGAASAVSGDGSVAVVDAPGYSGKGAAYVFTRSGNTWTVAQMLTALDGAAGDQFGVSAAISQDGTTLLIGAAGKSPGGAVYAYQRVAGSYVFEQEFIATPTSGTLGFFGAQITVSNDGTTALIGDFGSGSGGAAYIFTRSGTVWTQQQQLNASDELTNDYFGASVALSGDGQTALVGAEQHPLSTDQGAAYVFTRNGGTWTQQQELLAADGASGDFFGGGGGSVAISQNGSSALIGAWGHNGNTGTAYWFTRSGATWTQQQEFIAADTSSGDEFATTVAMTRDGSMALLGAQYGNGGTGEAYVFSNGDTGWVEDQPLRGSDIVSGDLFGDALAITDDGAIAFVGAYFHNNYSGSVYVFAGTPAPTPVPESPLAPLLISAGAVPVLGLLWRRIAVRRRPGAYQVLTRDREPIR